MTTRVLVPLLVLAVGCIAARDSRLAVAVDVDFVSYSERLEALESEFAALKTQDAGYVVSDSGKNACQKCGKGACCCLPTWYVGGELPWLQVQDTALLIPGAGPITPNFGQEPSIRAWAGRELCDGIGFRATVWTFDDETGPQALGPVSLAFEYEFYTIDFELTHRGQFCGFDIVASGGVRIAGMEQALDIAVLGATVLDIAREWDGAGLTFGVGFTRPVGNSACSLYGNFRGSLLFGDTDIRLDTPPIGGVATLENQTMMVWEIQLGVQVNREVSIGNVFARAGVEAQVWELAPIFLGIGDDNVGLFGPVFAVGLER